MHDTIVPMTLAEMPEILISGGKGMKKRYRRLLCVMLASVMALAGTGCSSGQKEGEIEWNLFSA